jgi:hypothetical protein
LYGGVELVLEEGPDGVLFLEMDDVRREYGGDSGAV